MIFVMVKVNLISDQYTVYKAFMDEKDAMKEISTQPPNEYRYYVPVELVSDVVDSNAELSTYLTKLNLDNDKKILVEKLIHNAYNEGYAEGHYDGCFETISDREDL